LNHKNFIFGICFHLSFFRTFYLFSLLTTMSLSENLWSVETPPRSSATKRQKTDPEIIMKVECLNSSFSEAFKKHVIFLQKITAISSHDIKVLNKRSKVLKDSSLQALTNKHVYKITSIFMSKKQMIETAKTPIKEAS
jgi:hypothetical protein